MDVITRLKKHYENRAPRLSFGGSEGDAVQTRSYDKWPEKETMQTLGVVVWRDHVKASPNISSPDGYRVVDACLDVSGTLDPDALPLPPEMQGHELQIAIFVDNLDCIRMRAIGGYSQPKAQT